MFNPSDIVQSGGLLLVGLFLYSEVALFLGFFLPGDTLLIAAGVFAHSGKLATISVILVAIIAAITGDSTAYFIGKKLGGKVFKKKDSLLFNADHIARAEVFYEKYGPKALLVAHFLPVVRTFTPLLAGVGKMPYRKFLIFNATGDIAWATSVTLIGYYIGSRVPNVDHYILLLVLAAMILTASPTIYHLVRMYLKNRSKNTEN
jgi:membrane-associated protein